MDDVKDQDANNDQKMNLNESKKQSNISIDEASALSLLSVDADVEDKEDQVVKDDQKMDLNEFKKQSNMSIDLTANFSLTCEKKNNLNLSYADVEDKDYQNVNDHHQKMDLKESKNNEDNRYQATAVTVSLEEISSGNQTYSNVEDKQDQVRNNKKMSLNESKNQSICSDQATVLSSCGNLYYTTVEDKKNPDVDVYGKMNLHKSKKQNYTFSDQETALSENEWEDEKPVSGTFQVPSGQQGKGQKNKHKSLKRRKKLRRSVSTTFKGQTRNFQICKNKILNLIHNKSGTETELETQSMSNIKFSTEIEQKHNVETESELQKLNSFSNKDQDPYFPRKNAKVSKVCKFELENKSELNDLCPLDSYLSSEEGNLNNTFNKSDMDFDKKVNHKFLPNSENVNREQCEYDNNYKTSNGSSGSKMGDENKDSLAYMINELRQTQNNLRRMVNSIHPSDIIMTVRGDIDKLSNDCIEKHMEKICKISKYIHEEKSCKPIMSLHKENLILQQKEFETSTSNAKLKFNSIQQSSIQDLISTADKIQLQIKNECSLFQRTFPAYAFKSSILNALKENQVVIVAADCSYFFNIVTLAVIQSELSCPSIISCENNNMASEYVKNKLESILNNTESFSKINYLTEDEMLNSFHKVVSPADFVAVVNLPLRRSISVDLLLAFLQEELLNRKGSRLVLLISIFDKASKYQKYFSTLKTFVLQVPELLLPVKTVWKKEPSKNYMEDVICTALSIHISRDPGNVLIFLPNLSDTKIAVKMFAKKVKELRIKAVNCIFLQGSNSPMPFNYQINSLERVFFFASDCAEIIPVQSVRYMVDCGLKRDYVFDSKKKIDVLATVFCSKSKAQHRKSLIRVYNQGVCYRVYTKDNFRSDMPSYEQPDVLTLDPFNSLIKIFRHSPENGLLIKFVNPINDVLKCSNEKLLRSFNVAKNGKLTQLGKKMVKLPLPARYSKLIFQAIEWGYGFEGVILAAYFSVDSFLFKHSENEDTLQLIDAAKLGLLENESDALSFLFLYKTWMQNEYSESWCDDFFINHETLVEVKEKISEICQYINDYNFENIIHEFNESEDSSVISSDLTKIIFHSFWDHFCVFSGHFRSGYRILQSSQMALLHPSSMISCKYDLPQLIVFNKMISDKQNFLVGVTAVSSDLVYENITGVDKILESDYTDIFEKTLIKKTIEPVSERIIQMLLIGNNAKLLEIEDFVKKELETESIVIEPLLLKLCVHIYALESFSESAVQMVDKILKNDIDDIINAEQEYTLEVKKGEITVPLEVKCVMGARIMSVKAKDSLVSTMGTNLVKETRPSVKYSLNLSWVRRPCNGICYIDFAKAHFNESRKLLENFFKVMGSKIHVEVSKKTDNQLLCAGIPREARICDIEESLKRCSPAIKVVNIEMIYTPSFETTNQELEAVKMDIEDMCEECLSEYEVIVPKPKDNDTLMKAYINVSPIEDLTEISNQLSNYLMNNYYKIDAEPEYQSFINVDIKIFKALKSHLVEELSILLAKLTESNSVKEPFKFDHSKHNDVVLLKIISNDMEIMKKLQRTLNEILEGEIINKNIVKDIHKLFCYGGQVWLRNLERSKTVVILEEFNSKIIRIYGSKENCFKVKRCIINFLEDTESETFVLNDDKSKRTLLKTLINRYRPNLELLIEECGLLKAFLNIKFNTLLLHGTTESITKAKESLKKLSSHIDSTDEWTLLGGGEVCPVCANPPCSKSFYLQNCHHSYCYDCILALITQANIPVQCCAENCSQDIILDDIIKVFKEDKKKITKVIRASLDDYLERHKSEIVHCPAPGCSMFFFIKEVSGRWECPLCQNEICIKCNVVYHYGYYCDDFQGTKKDPDLPFKEWRKRTVEFKNCPKCQIPIEKKDNCFHITCMQCKSNYCWFCVREFRTSHEVYNHYPFCEIGTKDNSQKIIP